MTEMLYVAAKESGRSVAVVDEPETEIAFL
jgi:hypothetical protein